MHTRTIVQPTAGQIAKLNALLRESEVLARQINFPMVSTSVSLCTGLLLEFKMLTEYDVDLEFNPINLLEIGLRYALFYYLSYIIHQKISSLVLSTFPKGVGYNRVQHRVHTMQKKLGTRDEVAILIKDLKKLISAQKSSLSKSFHYNIFLHVSLIMVVILSLGSCRLSFNVSAYGPSIAVVPINHHVPLTYLSRIVRYQQELTFLNFFYNKWVNYDIPEQLQSFLKKIKTISCIPYFSSQNWQIVDNEISMKESVIFLLKSSEKIMKLYDQDNELPHEISTENYFIELHRLCLEEKIPVYLSSMNEIYVGFTDLNKIDCHRIQNNFFIRLVNIEKYEKNSIQILEKLNTLPSRILINESPWDYYVDVDENKNLQSYFYLNKNFIKKSFFGTYFFELKKTFPGAIKVDNEIITLSGIKNNNFSIIEVHFQEKPIEYDDAPPSSFTADSNEHKASISSSDQAQEKQGLASSSKNSSSKHSHFYSKAALFKPVSNNNAPKPDNFLYPIRVPWLAEGKGRGSLDPLVCEVVSTYLTKKEVVKPLENGEVHGKKKAHHTKGGGVGIQVCHEPYKDVHGETHSRSHLKLKYSNNIRIFGRNVGSGTDENGDYVHYWFDGPSFGH